MILFGGTEAAFVLGFKYGTDDHSVKNNAILAMAILAALGLSLGVLRHYYDIAKHRTVRGISWGFVMLDAAGDLTSLLAVTIRPPADRVAAGIYASELSLWIGVMLAGVVFNMRAHFRCRPSSPAALPSTHVDANEEQQADDQIAIGLSRQSSAFSVVVPEHSARPSSLRLRSRLRFVQSN
ncbi:hypothetical protein CBS101457_006881 [Exobasidium rhododendri]|nr:hypothetical protein CBS101457_006881 [Exobasidium rhododendri]